MKMTSRMPLLLAVLAPAATPLVAQADPVLTVDRPCYADPSVRSDTVQIKGTGFTPGKSYSVSLDGNALPGGAGTVASDGTVTGTLPVPSLDLAGKRKRVHSFVLQVSDGVETEMT